MVRRNQGRAAMNAVASAPPRRRWAWRGIGLVLLAYLLVVFILMWWWDSEPGPFDPVATAQADAAAQQRRAVEGYVTVATLKRVADTMLHKRGGYLSNDIAPPGVLMDNMPNWEFGVLVQVRDLTRALRNDFSRSQTQSTEDPDLQEADPLFHYASDRWIFVSTESRYRTAIGRLDGYLARLADDDAYNAQFYARADNLADWLAVVEKRLGSLSQRLSASVGRVQANTDLAGDPAATQSTPTPALREVRTSWWEIDDVFYEARGTCWALIHLLKAAEHDFAAVLADKNAGPSLAQIIRELEQTQEAIWSPMILNGRGFGFFANHSLVMANYMSRANAALIDLRSLLQRG
jgi:hypothetical protein